MKYKSILQSILLCVVLLLSGCNTAPEDESQTQKNQETENVVDTESLRETEPLPEEIDRVETDSAHTSDIIPAGFPENFTFPITDGSTSTTNLDKAVRSAILG